MRRLALFLAVCCTLCMPTAALAREIGVNVALQAGKTAILIGADGEVKVPAGVYSVITSISPSGTQPDQELFCAFPSADPLRNTLGRDALLLNAEGEALSEAVYQYLSADPNGILYMRDGLYGVMDASQIDVIPCTYTSLVSNGENGYLALTSDPYDEKPDGVYYVDANGTETPTGIRIIYRLNAYNSGLMPVVSSENYRTGYLSARGEWAIQPQFRASGDFIGDYALASIDSGAGLIDKSGNWLLTPKYRNISISLDGRMILAETNQSLSLIDPVRFEVIATYEGTRLYCNTLFDNALAVIGDASATKLIDPAGNVLIARGANASFDSFSEMGDRVVVQEGVSGELNTYLCTLNGEQIFGPVQSIWYLGALQGGASYAYATYDVKVETEKELDWQGYWEIQGTRKIGVIDENGNVLIEPSPYQTMDYVMDGLMRVQTQTEVGLIDETGQTIMMFPIEAYATKEPEG